MIMNLDDDSLFHQENFTKYLQFPEQLVVLPIFNHHQEQQHVYCLPVKSEVEKIEEDQSFKPMTQSSRSLSHQEKQKQLHPNLLKNIVTIIKTWVKIPNNVTEETKILWQYFMNAKKVNHHLIKFAFGIIDETEEDWKFLLQSTEKNCFTITIDKAIEAHKRLQYQIVKQIKEANIQYIIKNRRVKNPKIFQRYFIAFIQFLEQGGVDKSFKVSKMLKNSQKAPNK